MTASSCNGREIWGQFQPTDIRGANPGDVLFLGINNQKSDPEPASGYRWRCKALRSQSSKVAWSLPHHLWLRHFPHWHYQDGYLLRGIFAELWDVLQLFLPEIFQPSYAIAASVAWFLSGGFAMAGAITKTRCMIVATMVRMRDSLGWVGGDV